MDACFPDVQNSYSRECHVRTLVKNFAYSCQNGDLKLIDVL